MPVSSSTRAKAHRSTSPSGDPRRSVDGNTNKAVSTILKSRKCWRNLKGKEEAVWPPELEAALIEGLERYRPAEAKSNRVLGRFPMRNKFVADHIFDTTGHRRTPKQVGSRIQQLRDTSSGKLILKAISDRHYDMMHPNRPRADDQEYGASASSAQPCHASPFLPVPAVSTPSHVYINTLPPCSTWTSFSTPTPLGGVCSQEPRPLRAIDPSVTFSSPGRIACQSVFQVFKDGLVVHQEYTPVTVSSSPMPGTSTAAPMFIYSTTLVPQYWPYLTEVEDLSAYTIYQQVVSLSSVATAGSPVIMSVMYHFLNASAYSLPMSPPPLSPRSSCDESEIDFSALSSESSPSPLLDRATLTTPLSATIDSTGMSGLLFNFEDEYADLPPSPNDFPTADVQPWSYATSALCASPVSSSASACDSYLEAAALFDAFVYR